MIAWLRHRVAYIILTIGLAVALSATVAADRRNTDRVHRSDQRDITRNCQTGQRSWDTLSAVIHTAYESRSLDVDPKTLPPRTQRLLADLSPLLKASAGTGQTTEERVLERLGPRPEC